MTNQEYISKAGFEFANITEGTEKQINWATQIREKFLVDLMVSYVDGPFPGIRSERIRKRMATAVEKINKETSARFWIDNRDELRRLFRV